jgi:hypothetical protein
MKDFEKLGCGGDTKAERAAVLAEADSDAKSKLGEPIPERNAIPHSPHPE